MYHLYDIYGKPLVKGDTVRVKNHLGLGTIVKMLKRSCVVRIDTYVPYNYCVKANKYNLTRWEPEDRL
jgi:hypothetical protein